MQILTKTASFVACSLAICSAVGCSSDPAAVADEVGGGDGGSASGGTGGTAGMDAGGTDAGGTGDDGCGGVAEAASGDFDPERAGISMFLELGEMVMMGQQIQLVIAGFMNAGREDFDESPDPDVLPLDTCVIPAAARPPVPGCACDAECPPDQKCLPEKDNGEPVPDTERCRTPRTMLDVGSMFVEGGGDPLELVFNPGQSGAYTTPGSDGTVPAGTLVGGTTYTLSGGGDVEQGLGAFSGEIYLPPTFTLSSPPIKPDPMLPISIIDVDSGNDLVLTWEVVGSTDSAGALNINLAGASWGGEGGGINCRASDDGEFTIPAEMVGEAKLGESAFLNMLTIEREGPEGEVKGDGITVSEIGALQTFTVNVQPLAPAP